MLTESSSFLMSTRTSRGILSIAWILYGLLGSPSLGQGANVFLSSAELAAIASILGRLPTAEEYLAYASKIDSMAPEIYQYLNFDQVPEFLAAAEKGRSIAQEIVVQA